MLQKCQKLPCRYRDQNKSWMDSTLFENLVSELENQFEKGNRKVALIIDTCTARSFLSSSKHDFGLTANGSRGYPFFKTEIQN